MQTDNTLRDYPDILTVQDASMILRVGKKTVYSLMNTGQLRYKKIGKKYVTSKMWLQEYFSCTSEKEM